jgi:hypothetical protein
VPGWSPKACFGESGFRVRFAPFEEDVYGAWEKGKLCLTAKTSSAGPGYHAFLVDFLDGLGVLPTIVEDETGYYESRDFSLLQGEMGKWLKFLSAQILQASGDALNLVVSLPIECVPQQSQRFACCPLGFFEKEFFIRAAEGKPVGDEFFIWWNRAADAPFFLNCAMNLIWCEINWIEPQLDEETENVNAALGCLEKALSMDRGLAFPAAEWLELASLSGNRALEETIRARFGEIGEGKMGYRRELLTSRVNRWFFTRRGAMHSDAEDNGSLVWWDDDHTIRVSALSFARKDGAVPNSKEGLEIATGGSDSFQPFKLRDESVAAAVMETQIEEDGELIWQTQLAASLDTELLVLDVFYPHEEDRDLAFQICASVAHS